ncbi:spore coat protein [Desulfotomaculum copahuensis]|uniref:Coat protein F n=1 Tax=Desulfotomaculum copahuensis TaxID=1838280 RepID=A0A1B7LHV4_9FIRM|nr:spore coat protein [Desulfotomaculum copahuensis]OAT85838.1 hypothetical protein A6M21_05000 [Desulfotomaculum copahuensis]
MLDDRMMLLDAMVSDKHESGDYNIRSIETANPQLLQLFQSIYQDEQRHVHIFMDAMIRRGWHMPMQAHQQDISRVQGEAAQKAGKANAGQAVYQPPGGGGNYAGQGQYRAF